MWPMSSLSSSEPVVKDTEQWQRSSRDTSRVPAVLSGWLSTVLPGGVCPEVTVNTMKDANGLSSETIVVTGRWNHNRATAQRKWVVRVAPSGDDVPMLPSYRLDHQFATMRGVAELKNVPVPQVRWLENTGEVLGWPFLVMDFVEGTAPPIPYTLGNNWFADAAPQRQREMADAAIEVLAKLHSTANADDFGYLTQAEPPGVTALHRRLNWLRQLYDFASRDIGVWPLVERTLAWLQDNLPAEVSTKASVLLWGDVHIGNILYRDFQPVAVLDWELATIGPPEFDVASMIYTHRGFQAISSLAGLPGLPELLREADVVAAYQEFTGTRLSDLHWFYVYFWVFWACAGMRVMTRRIYFGEIDKPDHVESLPLFVAHAAFLNDLIG
jgi:aminoglycoside phosphotransferase (APT) family kinase protein